MSSQDSKLPFVIIVPFAAVVLGISLRSGAPRNPSMPGVVLPVAPVVVAPAKAVQETPSAPEVIEEVVTPTQESSESWE